MRARKNTASPRHTFRTRKQPQVRARGRPGGDHRHRDIGQLSFVDDKLGSAKKRTDSRTQQDRAQDAVQQQEYLIRLFCPGDSPSSTGIHTIRPAEQKQASISIHTQ